MLSRRATVRPTAPSDDGFASAGYRGLLKAAEANPEEFFSIAGDKLAALLRELEGQRGSRRKHRAS